MSKQGQSDRVSVSLGRKVSEKGSFGSFDVHVSYSTDVEADETPLKAMQRATAFVEKALEVRVKRALKKG